MARAIRFYRTDDGAWFDKSEDAKSAARDRATLLNREVRVSAVVMEAHRASILRLLQEGLPVILQARTLYVAKPEAS